MKERGVGARAMGAAEVSEVITHAAVGLDAAGHLHDGRVALLTDGTVGSGLEFTGWERTLLEDGQISTADGAAALQGAVAARLPSVGLDADLALSLLKRTHLVWPPWHVAAETRHDLATAYSLTPAVASLAYAVIVGHVSSVAAAQRTSPASAPQSVTVTDLDRIVAEITAAVDVATLEEAIRAGVCEPADYLHRSDLSYEQFLAGVDV